MIDLYIFLTPNGRKPVIWLEELALPYTVKTVHIGKGEQFAPEFVALNPNRKIPVIGDTETGLTGLESGLILIDLAEQVPSELGPQSRSERRAVLPWLRFQSGSVGPMLGQHGHFKRAAPDHEYGIQRDRQETLRLLTVMDGRLAQREDIAGPIYSIADIAIYPWVMTYDLRGVTLDAPLDPAGRHH